MGRLISLPIDETGLAAMKAMDTRAAENGKVGAGFVIFACRIPVTAPSKGGEKTILQKMQVPIYISQGRKGELHSCPGGWKQSLLKESNG